MTVQIKESVAAIIRPVPFAGRITSGGVEHTAATLMRTAREASALPVFYLGRQPYRPVWDLQRRLHAWRVEDRIPDLVLLLEHDPVYTLGKNAHPAHLLDRRPPEADVVASDRGGDVTYHGPGQLVGYPSVDLRRHRPSVTWYMRGLEEVLIRTLAAYDVAARRIEGLPGVWVHQQKVAALGVRLARWCTMHGFALNVDVPRSYFDGMIPCGILEYGVLSLNELLSKSTDVQEVARRITPHLQDFLGGRNGQVSWVHQDPVT